MNILVLVRHGASIWSKEGENKFAGWSDIELSETGIQEAIKAGKLLKEKGFDFRFAYSSYLKRATKTLFLILEEMEPMWITIDKTWRLNEKHYGELQGFNKSEMEKKYGKRKVNSWRHSYNGCPPPVDMNDKRHPRFDPRYSDLAIKTPFSESVKDIVNRIVPFWETEMSKKLLQHKSLLVVAHDNSIRGILKHLKKISEEETEKIKIFTGMPYKIEMDDELNILNDDYIRID
jgi:2,3-bisphosphoglycerate-dependent phosphoglycerate mutase